jgi:hypothetical protein
VTSAVNWAQSLSLSNQMPQASSSYSMLHISNREGVGKQDLGWQGQNMDKLHNEWFSPLLDSWVECCRNMFWKGQLHMVFQLVACTHGIQKTMTSKNALEKINLKCIIHKP